MKEEITAKKYREDKKIEFDTIKFIVDKHFETLWKIAEEFRIVSPNTPFRIETIYGDFQFIPNYQKDLTP